MLPNANNKHLLTIFVALMVASVALKVAAGEPDDGQGAKKSQVENQLAEMLGSQGFSINVAHKDFQPSIVHATRGDCRLIVADARGGAQYASLFLRDATQVGAVRYLYRGEVSDSLPETRAWLDRFANKLTNRLAIHRRIAVPVALATSPGCGGQDFGLTDFRA